MIVISICNAQGNRKLHPEEGRGGDMTGKKSLRPLILSPSPSPFPSPFSLPLTASCLTHTFRDFDYGPIKTYSDVCVTQESSHKSSQICEMAS